MLHSTHYVKLLKQRIMKAKARVVILVPADFVPADLQSAVYEYKDFQSD